MARPVLAYSAEPSRPPAPPRPKWLTPAVAMLAAVYLAVFFYWLIAGAVLKPYSDSYSFIFDAWRWRDGSESFLAYLWSPHIGHHMVWVRLVVAFEVAVSKSAWPSVLTCSAALIGAAAIIAARAWGDRQSTTLGGPCALLCAMLVLTDFNALDANQPLNALYPFCLVFSVASLSLFVAGSTSPKSAWVWRPLALLCAMAAALGNGAALALWPVLLVLALFSGERPILWACAVAGVGGLFGLTYLSGEGQIAELGAAGGGAGDPLRRVIYAFDDIALPWSQLSALGGAALGVAMTGVAVWAIALSRRRGATAEDRFAWGLILFTLVTAALAAAGRGGLGDLRAPMRYAVFSAPLQAGVVMLLAPEVERRFAARSWAVAALAMGAVGLLLVQQVVGGLFVMRSVDKIRATIADYESGRRTPVMTQLIYPDLIFVDRVEGRLRAARSFGKAPGELAPRGPGAPPPPSPDSLPLRPEHLDTPSIRGPLP